MFIPYIIILIWAVCTCAFIVSRLLIISILRPFFSTPLHMYRYMCHTYGILFISIYRMDKIAALYVAFVCDSNTRHGQLQTRKKSLNKKQALQPLTQARIQASAEGIVTTNLPPCSKISQDPKESSLQINPLYNVLRNAWLYIRRVFAQGSILKYYSHYPCKCYICTFHRIPKNQGINTVHLIMVPHLKLLSICSVTSLPQNSASICHAPGLAQTLPHDAMYLPSYSYSWYGSYVG